jgi:hypothetical protein
MDFSNHSLLITAADQLGSSPKLIALDSRVLPKLSRVDTGGKRKREIENGASGFPKAAETLASNSVDEMPPSKDEPTMGDRIQYMLNTRFLSGTVGQPHKTLAGWHNILMDSQRKKSTDYTMVLMTAANKGVKWRFPPGGELHSDKGRESEVLESLVSILRKRRTKRGAKERVWNKAEEEATGTQSEHFGTENLSFNTYWPWLVQKGWKCMHGDALSNYHYILPAATSKPKRDRVYGADFFRSEEEVLAHVAPSTMGEIMPATAPLQRCEMILKQLSQQQSAAPAKGLSDVFEQEYAEVMAKFGPTSSVTETSNADSPNPYARSYNLHTRTGTIDTTPVEYSMKCSICLEEDTEMLNPVHLPCRHAFCCECLRQYFAYAAMEKVFTRSGVRATCPNCREVHVVHPSTLDGKMEHVASARKKKKK